MASAEWKMMTNRITVKCEDRIHQLQQASSDQVPARALPRCFCLLAIYKAWSSNAHQLAMELPLLLQVRGRCERQIYCAVPDVPAA